MTDHFQPFARAVNARLHEMSKHELYVVDTVTDHFDAYLRAFPLGSDPMFRERTTHHCQCCRRFVRGLGGVVSLQGGTYQTVWDVEGFNGVEEPYRTVAAEMARHVRQLPVGGLFRTPEEVFGAQATLGDKDDGRRWWNHLWGEVESRHRCPGPNVDRVLGEARTDFQTMDRGLREIDPAAVAQVLELIAEGLLYRGAEHRTALLGFQRAQQAYLRAPDRHIHVWANLNKGLAHFRNSVIGTLAVELSQGTPVEDAVRMFESKVAPANYRRPRGVVTSGMIDKALATLKGLGLESAVERRFARFSDLSVNDVLFVDVAVRNKLKGGLKELLLPGAKGKKLEAHRVPKVPVMGFVEDILPTAASLELVPRNAQLGNLVSLTAPVHPDAGRLFGWDNGFAWSYRGDAADSIREKVKKAGGDVQAALRVSLAWRNFDDLDLHAVCPEGHVFYGNKQGILDVDMNAGGGRTRTPVENLSWRNPRDGAYEIRVHQYYRRENVDLGFELEFESLGEVKRFAFPKAVQGIVPCLSFNVVRGKVMDLVVHSGLTSDLTPRRVWGIETEVPVGVAVMLKSPNHWEGIVPRGNRHWFFVLDGCRNDEGARGVYNEFLRPELAPHGKVFEVLGARTRCAPEPNEPQLSGMGFSEGRGDSALVFVTTQGSAGNSRRAYDVVF